jgi:DNA-binding transcriptional LysR family regulator
MPPASNGPMLDLNDFFYFVQVVERRGFTAAGRALRMPKSTLSYRMKKLEAELGVRLLNRTSRHFAPTQAGEEFYRHATNVVRAADEAESLVRQRVKEPFGVVRFTAAIGTAQFALREIVMNFIQENPRIQLVEYVTSRQIDLLTENFDVAVRAHSGALPDSTLVSRTLAVAPWILVAGTAFLKKGGAPKTPEDLKRFPSLFLWRANTAPAWRLRAIEKQQRQSEVTLILTPRMVSNDLSTLKQAAVSGMGIAALPAYVCQSELRSRRLTRIMPGWLAGESTFTALLPHRLGLLPAVRIFVDYLARHLPERVQPGPS